MVTFIVWLESKLICLQSVFFFCFLRNDLKTREARFFARFDSNQNQNPTNPHPSHHPAVQPQAAVQAQPTSEAQHAHDQDQYAKPAIQPPATRPPHYSPGSHKAGGGDGRGGTTRVHAQGDCAERVWGFVQHSCQRICWSTRWIVLMVMMTLHHLHCAAENTLINDLCEHQKSALGLMLVSLKTTWIYGTKTAML